METFPESLILCIGTPSWKNVFNVFDQVQEREKDAESGEERGRALSSLRGQG